jgi:hypothetical protein
MASTLPTSSSPRSSPCSSFFVIRPEAHDTTLERTKGC